MRYATLIRFVEGYSGIPPGQVLHLQFGRRFDERVVHRLQGMSSLENIPPYILRTGRSAGAGVI